MPPAAARHCAAQSGLLLPAQAALRDGYVPRVRGAQVQEQRHVGGQHACEARGVGHVASDARGDALVGAQGDGDDGDVEARPQPARQPAAEARLATPRGG